MSKTYFYTSWLTEFTSLEQNTPSRGGITDCSAHSRLGSLKDFGRRLMQALTTRSTLQKVYRVGSTLTENQKLLALTASTIMSIQKKS